jgi:hypothetical protein
MEESVKSGVTVSVVSYETGDGERGVFTSIDSLLVNLEIKNVGRIQDMNIPDQC